VPVDDKIDSFVASGDTTGTAAEDFESEDPSLKLDESLSGADELDMNAFEIANLGKGGSRAFKLPAKTLPISLDVGESKMLRELLGRRKRCILSKYN
jgi:hypothetical protein